MGAKLAVQSGSIYLRAEDYKVYFQGLDAVIVLIRDDALHILPVQQMMSGGYLLKIRNSKGDRVVAAPDVFFAHGLAEWSATNLKATWSIDHGALVCPLP